MGTLKARKNLIYIVNLAQNERSQFLRVKSALIPTTNPTMLLAALKLQLAALVTVAGIDTADIRSPGVKTALESLDKATKEITQGKGGDINQSSAEAVKAINELAAKEGVDGADASYCLARWAGLGVLGQQFSIQQVINTYEKAAKGGNVPAMAELGGILLQNFPQDTDKVKRAVELVKAAEAKDNDDARRMLAQLTLSGVPSADIAQDTKAALALFEEGSKANDGQSSYSLAQIYAKGLQAQAPDGTAKEELKADEAKAKSYLELAASQEFAPAMNDLATLFFVGEGPDGKGKDPKKGFEMFNKAAEKGSAAAHRLLGQIYENGLGDQPRNLDKALEHYLIAARANDGAAQLWMGNASQTGYVKDSAKDKKDVKDIKPDEIAVAPSPAAALQWYRLAAQNNIPQALYFVGVFYETGTVVDKDLNKAFSLVQRAAQQGVPAAGYRLATYYQQGAGVGQDVVAAGAWYERAAKAGLPQAQLVYGAMLENGVGMEQSITAAAAQYLKASDAGLPQAMINLAQIYERGGGGLLKDVGKAWLYAALAVDASNGNEDAKKYRDKLEAELSKDKTAFAQAKKDYEDKKAKMTSGGAPAAPAASSTESSPKSKKGSK
jgi:hypothetical protein